MSFRIQYVIACFLVEYGHEISYTYIYGLMQTTCEYHIIHHDITKELVNPYNNNNHFKKFVEPHVMSQDVKDDVEIFLHVIHTHHLVLSLFYGISSIHCYPYLIILNM